MALTTGRCSWGAGANGGPPRPFPKCVGFRARSLLTDLGTQLGIRSGNADRCVTSGTSVRLVNHGNGRCQPGDNAELRHGEGDRSWAEMEDRELARTVPNQARQVVRARPSVRASPPPTAVCGARGPFGDGLGLPEENSRRRGTSELGERLRDTPWVDRGVSLALLPFECFSVTSPTPGSPP